MTHNIRNKIITLCYAIAIITLQSCPALSVTRGTLLQNVLISLQIPMKHCPGKYTDVPPNHPLFKYIETARALGIIFPGERFHPDMEITRAESVMFAFKAMGWIHEASIAQMFSPPLDEDIPDYIMPYLILGKQVIPRMPMYLLDNTRDNLKENDLKKLMEWITDCRKHMEWQIESGDDNIKLIVHREGVGTAPHAWSVPIEEFSELSKAKERETKLKKYGLRTYIDNNGCAYSLYAGPFSTYPEAWESLKKLPLGKSKTVAPTGKQHGDSIFWAAISALPSKAKTSIVTAPQIGGFMLPISHIASNSDATAAINGGFFAGRYPVGSIVSGGFPLSAPYGQRSAVAWNTAGNVLFASGYFRTSAQHGTSRIPVSYINRIPRTDSVAIFSRFWGSFADPVPGNAIELTVKNDIIKEKNDSFRSNHFIPHDGYLLVARGNKKEIFRELGKATPLSVSLSWQDKDMSKFPNVIQGGPLLLANGKPTTDTEGLSRSISNRKHPRTIVGSDGKRVYWMVIDGRNSWHSAGLTLDETRRLLMDLGLKNALNLDGGGSSELWWKGKIINLLPSGSERRVPYCVVFR